MLSAKNHVKYLCVISVFALTLCGQTPAPHPSRIGQERAIPQHLADDDEFDISLAALIEYGKRLFCANWTEQDGAGRPLTKGTGKPVSDPSSPLKGARAWNRISAPDANSCAGCHNAPFGIP